MASIIINDLNESVDLDRQALAKLTGGCYSYPWSGWFSPIINPGFMQPVQPFIPGFGTTDGSTNAAARFLFGRGFATPGLGIDATGNFLRERGLRS